MPETHLNTLTPRLLRQVDLARTAIDRDNPEYAINLCQQILAQQPGCLAVRRMLRAAQLQVFKKRNPIFARPFGMIRGLPALLGAMAAIKKSPTRAISLAESALNAVPDSSAPLRILAKGATRLGLSETAVFALEIVCERERRNVGACIELADAYIGADRPSDALTVAENLAREHPHDAEVQELIKRASVAKSIAAGQWDSGSGTFRDKLRDEQQAISLEQAGKVTTSKDAAERLLEEARARLEAEPTNLSHHRAVIGAYRKLGRFDEALVALAVARGLPSAAADVGLEKLEGELRIVRCEARVRERQETVATLGLDPANDAELRHLQGELASQRMGEARRLAEKYPNDLGLKFELGRLHQAAGEIEPAIQQFQAAQRSPKHRLAALRHLGECFRAKGLLDLALQQFETAKAELPEFDDEKKEVVYQLAGCLEAMGQAERALEEYKSIYSVDIGFRDIAAKIDGFYAKNRQAGAGP